MFNYCLEPDTSGEDRDYLRSTVVYDRATEIETMLQVEAEKRVFALLESEVDVFVLHEVKEDADVQSAFDKLLTLISDKIADLEIEK